MRNPRQAGFTLTELMVVIALIGVLVGIAVAASNEGRAGSRGFADQLSGELETVRMRALATRRWHRVTLSSNGAAVEQASTTGMARATAWEWIGGVTAPRTVRVVAMASSTILAGGAAPADGDGLTEEILFSPDGSSVPRTVWVSDRKDRAPFRLALFAATGHIRVYEGW